MDGQSLSFDQHGAARHDLAALDAIDALELAFAGIGPDRAGVRLYGDQRLRSILSSGSSIAGLAAMRLGLAATPVRAILFDKTPGANWALGWHQDRTVAVRARVERPNWGPWSLKAGIQHVEPPFAVIKRMVTLRIHLDAVPISNAPLLIAPGSHRLGRLRGPEIADAVRHCGTAACLANRGDVWAYATPIVHASAASTGSQHRRVLQVDYAAGPLEPPLEWLGI